MKISAFIFAFVAPLVYSASLPEGLNAVTVRDTVSEKKVTRDEVINALQDHQRTGAKVPENAIGCVFCFLEGFAGYGANSDCNRCCWGKKC